MRRIIFAAVAIAAVSGPACAADMARGPYYAPQRRRSGASTTGPVSMPAPTSAISGAAPPITRPRLRRRRRRAGRLQLAERPVRVRRRNRLADFRRRRHLRAVEVLQSVVRHLARPRRLRLQQRVVLRHARPRLWRRDAARSPGLSETKTHIGWAGGIGVEVGLNRAWSARAPNISTSISTDRTYTITGANNGLDATCCASASTITSKPQPSTGTRGSGKPRASARGFLLPDVFTGGGTSVKYSYTKI